jgi:uncharacterized protein YjbI with pentapeptide repeats
MENEVEVYVPESKDEWICLLKKSVSEFNFSIRKFRLRNPKKTLSLAGADFSGKSLFRVDLYEVDLSYVNFCGTALRAANLARTNLAGIKFNSSTELYRTNINGSQNVPRSFLELFLKQNGPKVLSVDETC